MEDKAIIVLAVRPGERPVLEVLDGSLEAMQAVVGGHLEQMMPFEDDVAIVCNDEGKLYGLPLNRAMYDRYGEMFDIIAGPFFVCYAPADSERYMSLPEELVHKYAALFEAPEQFSRDAAGLLVRRDVEMVPEYLGVCYDMHPFKNSVDIEFMDKNGETIEWHTVEEDSEEYGRLDAVAKEWAGSIAIAKAKALCEILDNGRSVDEVISDAVVVQDARECEDMAIDILQLRDGDDMRFFRFAHLDWLDNGVDSVVCKNYNHIYRYGDEDAVDMDDEMAVMDLLEKIYTRFNVRHPEDFKGHALSVSDVVVLSNGKDRKAYYCDWIGFQELPQDFVKAFQASLERENGRDFS